MSGLTKILEIAGTEISELERDVNIEREKRIEAENKNGELMKEIAELKRQLSSLLCPVTIGSERRV